MIVMLNGQYVNRNRVFSKELQERPLAPFVPGSGEPKGVAFFGDLKVSGKA